MREQLKSARSLKYISIAQAAMIAYLVALLIYILASISQNSGVMITPSITMQSQAVTSPAISTSPTVGTQQPTSKAAAQPAYNQI